jgi:hypothetical protein
VRLERLWNGVRLFLFSGHDILYGIQVDRVTQLKLKTKTKMKNMKQKLQRWIPSALIGLALSTSVGFGSPVITVNTFDDATPVNNNIWNWYGGSSFSFDATQDHTGNGGGSLHISQPSALSDDTIIVPETWLPGSGAWWQSSTVNLTTYTNVSLWFKWDTNNSTMSISTFNTEGTGGFTVALNDNVTIPGNDGPWHDPNRHFLPYTQIPNAASNGWVHLNFAVSATIPNIDQIGAVEYYDWKPAPWSGTVAFWVDDVTIEPAATDVIPAPTISPLAKATPGLNVFASTDGSVYDRQSAMLQQTTGLGWIGQASTGNPVSYSFTIANFPRDPATYGCEAWLFLSPNPVANDSAPDWNETNCVIAFIQVDTNNNTILHFQYKVNEDHQQAMYSGVNEARGYYTNAPGSWNGVTTPWLESGNLGSVTNPTALGTWTIRFTSSSNVTLIAPGGNTNTFVIPAYNVGYLAEGANGMNVYLGMQANNTASLNKAVVYSNFAISGSGTPFSENFLADTVLDTTNTWRTSQAAGSAGVLIAPAGSAYWLSWTLPDGGFSSEVAPTLTNPLGWTSLAGNRVVMNAIRSQLIPASSLPVGNSAFFALVKRTFTKLQILLPGETNAPNTSSGKIGTPIDQSVGVPFDVIVNSVDNNWNVVNGANDQIAFTSTGDFVVVSGQTQPSLSGGTVTASVEFMSGGGSATFTATDYTDGSKAADSSFVSY